LALKTTKNLILSIENIPDWCDIDVPTDLVSTSEDHGNESKTVSKPLDWTMDAYTRVLESILFRERKDEFFPSVTEIMAQWKIFSNSLKCIEETLLGEKEKKVKKEEKEEKKIMNIEANGCLLTMTEMEADTRTYGDEVVLRTYTVGSSIQSIVENKK
jgi:hypothetical protein